jgi:hypothetical protein
MTFEQLQNVVNEALDLIPINAVALTQSKDRSSKFLVVQAILLNHLKSLEEAKAQVSTISNGSYFQALSTGTSNKVTENKAQAESNPEYTKNREALENLDAEINWTKGHLKIFDNAHILFRQFSKE